MINAVQIISSWMRTTGHLTDIMDDDYKTLLAQVQLGLDAQRHQALTEAAEITSKWMLSNQLHPNIPNEKLNESAKVAAHSVLQQAALSILTDRDGEVTK